MQSGGGRVRFGWGHHDLLDVIGGDSGRGCVAPNHALVHLHQVLLLLLHSKTAATAKSLPSPACSSLHAAAAAVSSPAQQLLPLRGCFRAGGRRKGGDWRGGGFARGFDGDESGGFGGRPVLALLPLLVLCFWFPSLKRGRRSAPLDVKRPTFDCVWFGV